MALLQLSDRRLLHPLICRAIPDGLDVALMLEIETGQSCQKRLRRGQKRGRAPPGSTRSSVTRLTVRVGSHVFPRLVIACCRSLAVMAVRVAAVFHTNAPLD